MVKSNAPMHIENRPAGSAVEIGSTGGDNILVTSVLREIPALVKIVAFWIRSDPHIGQLNGFMVAMFGPLLPG